MKPFNLTGKIKYHRITFMSSVNRWLEEDKHVAVNLISKGKSFRGCTFVTGFHGIGETGYVAVSYLVHALNAHRIGFIDVEKPPPFVTASESGLTTPFEIYRRGNIVLLKLEFPPHRSEEAQMLKTISSWVVKKKFKEAVLIGGLDIAFKSDESEIKIVPTSAYLNKPRRVKKPILDEGLFVFGPLAVLLSEFEIHNFPAVAILPYAQVNRADPGAAAVAIKMISKMCNLKVNTEELERDAKEIEEEVNRRVTQARESLKGVYI
jgi:uncharacterized protein